MPRVGDGALYLVRGDDDVLISRAVADVVDQLVGADDRTLMVEELTEANYRTDDGGYEIAPLIDAAQTPPFLTARRVVVGRHLGRFSKADELQPLARYLDDPLPTTSLVVVWEKGPDLQRLGAIPKALTGLIDAHGETLDVRVGRGKAASAWVRDTVTASGARLDRSAIALIEERLGEDRSRLPAILDTIVAAFGDTEVAAADVEPYLGQAGDVAPWELTDAIAAGSVAEALDKLHRMQVAGGRHPLQILASLHGHYGRLLRLDGSGLRDEKAAAAALGMKGSTFPAKKALQQARRLGSERVGRAIQLLAQADVDVRGATATPEAATMDVLVARLARLHR